MTATALPDTALRHGESSTARRPSVLTLIYVAIFAVFAFMLLG